MSEFRPNINYKAEGPPGGPPKSETKRLESLRAESLGGYPVEGRDVIEHLNYSEIREGKIDEVKEAIFEALAFKEGLEHGSDVEVYDLDNITGPGMVYLKGLFTTVDDSIGRPADHYLKPAIKSALEERVREYGEYNKRPDRWKTRQLKKAQLANRARIMEGKDPLRDDQIELLFIEPKQNELTEIGKVFPELQKLNNHVTAREIIDKAFVQRMLACENPEAAAKMSDKFGVVSSPDQSHWESFFRAEPEFGKAVNTAMEAIRDIALPDKEKLHRELDKKENKLIKEWLDNLRKSSPKQVEKLENLPWNIVETEGIPSTIYAEGFEDTEMFAKWLNNILKKDGVNGRIDVVWAAWKTALLMEIPSVLGKGVIATVDETIKDDNKILEAKVELRIGFPPLVSTLFSWIAHIEDKRAIEYGLGLDGKVNRVTQYVSHSGLPMSLGQFPDLCSGYLQEAKIELPSGEKIALWDIWTKGVSFADNKFPWTKTEIGDTRDAGELPGGTFGNWILRRKRSFDILDSIKLRPKLGDLSDPDFFTSKARTWDKIMPLKEETAPEDNPRAWWVAGLVWYHRAGTSTKCSLIKEKPYRDHRTVTRSEEMVPKGESAETRSPGHGDMFRHATNSGFLRKEDVVWIKKQLGIVLT